MRSLSCASKKQARALFAQRAATAHDPGLHRSHGNFHDLRHFLVRKPFKIPQDHGGTKDLVHASQRLLHGSLHFHAGKLVKGRQCRVFDFQCCASIFSRCVHRTLPAQVAPRPAALIERFAHRNAIEPRPQRTSLSKSSYAAERLQEDLLGDIRGVIRVTEHPGHKPVHLAVVVGDEPVERRLGAAAQLRHELGFVPRPG